MTAFHRMPQGLLKLLVCLLLASSLNLQGLGKQRVYADGNRDAYQTVQAEVYDAASSVRIIGNVIGNLFGGNWIRYNNVDFDTGAQDVVFKLGLPAASAGGKIEIRLDSTAGTLIGTLITQSTGSYGITAEQATAVSGATGVHDVYLVLVGGAGIANIDWFRFNRTYSIADTAPPITQAATAGSYSGGRYISAVTVTLSAYDYYRGVDVTEYSLDGGATWQIYSAPLVFDEDGAYDVQYRSTDKAGNTESAHMLSFEVEMYGSRSAFDAIQAEQYNDASRATVIGNVLGGLFGGNWIRYSNIDFDTGAQDVVFKLGLPAAAAGGKIEMRLDSANGTLIGTLITQSTGGYGITAEQATTVAGASGVHDVYLVLIGGAGIANIDWFAFNRTYSIADTAPPITQATVAGEYNGSYYTSAVTVTLSAYDYYRGVASTEYSLDGGATWQTYGAPVVFNQEGSYELRYRSIDKGGNTETAQLLPLVLDDLPLPSYFWLSGALQPGDIGMLIGENLGTIADIELYRLDDDNVDGLEPAYVRHPQPDAPFVPDVNPRATAAPWEESEALPATTVQMTQQGLKFIVPETEAPGVYAIRPIVPGKETAVLYANAPELVWAQGDQGDTASPDGWIRLVGRQLAVSGHTPQVVLEAVDGGELTRVQADTVYDAYAAQIKVPASLAAGEYRLYLHNGQGGAYAWSNPVALRVEPQEAWPQTVFNVKDYGARGDGTFNDTASVRDAIYAAGQAGGGIVYFPRGRYHLSNTLAIPAYTTIRGESRELTQLFFSPFQWDVNELPAAMIRGSHHFAIENISLNATRTGNFIVSDVDTPEAGDVFIRNIRIRANPFAGHPSVEQEKMIADEIRTRGTIDLLKIGGKNVQIVDNDLYGPNRPLNLVHAEGALVKGNMLYNGYTGWYSLSGPNGLLFEDNTITTAHMTATGGGVDKPIDHMVQNVYFARNTFKNTVGWDREAMTNDGGSGAYYGPVGAIDGTTLTLPEGGKNASWVPNTWNGGGGVFILSGKGAGQLRAIVSHTKDVVQLDSPFEVAPDATSVISITAIQRDSFYVNNRLDNTGPFQFYGAAVNMVVYGNELTQAYGFNAWGRLLYNGYQPDWYIDVDSNTLADGNYSHFYGIGDRWSGYSALRITAQGNDTLQVGAMIRRNRLSENSTILIAGGTPATSMRDVVISGNTFRDGERGITISGGVGGVVLYRNQFDGVDIPLSVPEPLLDSGKVAALD